MSCFSLAVSIAVVVTASIAVSVLPPRIPTVHIIYYIKNQRRGMEKIT